MPRRARAKELADVRVVGVGEGPPLGRADLEELVAVPVLVAAGERVEEGQALLRGDLDVAVERREVTRRKLGGGQVRGVRLAPPVRLADEDEPAGPDEAPQRAEASRDGRPRSSWPRGRRRDRRSPARADAPAASPSMMVSLAVGARAAARSRATAISYGDMSTPVPRMRRRSASRTRSSPLPQAASQTVAPGLEVEEPDQLVEALRAGRVADDVVGVGDPVELPGVHGAIVRPAAGCECGGAAGAPPVPPTQVVEISITRRLVPSSGRMRTHDGPSRPTTQLETASKSPARFISTIGLPAGAKSTGPS